MGDPTPMMRQYQELKARHPGTLLFFRLGDFFELFGDDARVASGELDLVLTTRDGEVPMCGIPHHALDTYLGRLMEKGYRVALAEQVEDPKKAKGLVRRDIVRVVTPSTWVEGLGGDEAALLAALADQGQTSALAAVVPSTGRFEVGTWSGPDAHEEARRAALRLGPVEWLAGPGWEGETLDGMPPVDGSRVHFSARSEGASGSLADGLPEGQPILRRVAEAVGSYLGETHPGALANLEAPVWRRGSQRLEIDPNTWRHLEIDRRADGSRGPGTLFHVLDATVTAVGRRTLRRWLEEPLGGVEAIRTRQGAVEALFADGLLRARLQKAMSRMRDVERILARLAIAVGGPHDLLALAESLEAAQEVRRHLEPVEEPLLREISGRILGPDDVPAVIRGAISADAPANWREGHFIRRGFDVRLDGLRATREDAQAFLLALEERVKRETGIKTLRVGFNKVFGYYIEVTRPHLHLVPATWERKQTLTGAERFVTPDLKEKERIVLAADEEALSLELALFEDIKTTVLCHREAMRGAVRAVGEVDALQSMAEVARRRRWVRPDLTEEPVLRLKAARHPVVEASQGTFVPNDLAIGDGSRLVVLTGPNMAGKSTFLRQAGLIVILAQMGSFVPAEEATVGLVDRLFSRIGATDDLARGRSTFMVEMAEVAEILKRATSRSLVLLDEIGRGTSTFDGISLAWAVAEDLHDRVGCRTLMATHYLELTDLEGLLEGAENWSVSAVEKGEEVIFLRRVVRGPADRSYGLHVARLAGVPAFVVKRARNILRSLEKGSLARREAAASGQLAFAFHEPAVQDTAPDPLRQALAEADPDTMTPREALAFLFRLKDLMEDR